MPTVPFDHERSTRAVDVDLPHPALVVLLGALGIGVGEVALRFAARAVRDTPVFLDPAMSWTGPLSALLLLAPLAAVTWVAASRLRPGSERRAVLVAVVAGGLLDVLLLLLPRLHVLAHLIVALGVAWQAARFVARRARAIGAIARWAALALLIASALLGRAASRDRGAPGNGAGQSRPSVLLLVLDTVRALQLSAYGYDRPTSRAIEEFARGGVRFERAIATAPWTLPTHASLFTGRYQRDLSLGWQTPLDGSSRTLAETFGAHGYATAGFVANMRYTTREYGLDRGFSHYSDYAVSPSQIIGSTMLGRRVILTSNWALGRYVLVGRKDAARVIDDFLRWRATNEERPFFAFLNFFDAHDPYAPSAPYDVMFGPEPPTRAVDPLRPYSTDDVRGLRDAYDGAIASLDAQLARLFSELRRSGELQRTIVVVTSDHGEEFAEHGHLGHGSGLHFPALHVPLVIHYPPSVPPAVVGESVSLVDVPQTILDLAGLRETAIAGFSLRPFWDARGSGGPARSPILSELYWAPNQPSRYLVSGGNMRSLVRGRLHYIAGPGTREELYDIVADPFETRNRLADSTLAADLETLRAELARFPMADRRGR